MHNIFKDGLKKVMLAYYAPVEKAAEEILGRLAREEISDLAMIEFPDEKPEYTTETFWISEHTFKILPKRVDFSFFDKSEDKFKICRVRGFKHIYIDDDMGRTQDTFPCDDAETLNRYHGLLSEAANEPKVSTQQGDELLGGE